MNPNPNQILHAKYHGGQLLILSISRVDGPAVQSFPSAVVVNPPNLVRVRTRKGGQRKGAES